MPDARDWVIVVLVLLLWSSSWLAADTFAMRDHATDALGAAERVMGCINGETTLGGEYKTADGATWVTICQTVEKRVRT